MTEAIFAPQPIKKTPQPRRVSLEAYFRAEEKAVNKHEYHDGIIVTMAGGTFNHDNLATQTTTVLNNFVFDNNYDYLVNGSDTKIRIEAHNKVVYPDALVVCEQPLYYDNRKDTILNPLIIVEVLSDSTKSYDQTTKFDMYRTIPSFKEYVLIYQDKKQASVYTKQSDGTWLLRDYEGDDAIAILYTLHNCPLPFKRLYRQIKLEKKK
jgi:Uma2 family endonuclease